MDNIKTERSVIRTAFTKLCGEIESILKEENYEVINVKVKFIILKAKYQKLQEYNKDMFDLMIQKPDESQIEKEITTCDEYEVRFLKLKLSINNNEQDKGPIVN